MPASPWRTLYALIWIALLEFLLAMTPDAPRWFGVAHVALGVAIVGIAFVNFRGVRATAVPGRVKRTAMSTMQLSVVNALLGGALLVDVVAERALVWGLTVGGVVLFAHVVVAFAIITQAAAVAIAYDMWEEKEFLQESTPGDVPAMPQPAKPAARGPTGARAQRRP